MDESKACAWRGRVGVGAPNRGYPSLLKKLSSGQHLHVAGAISFDALLKVLFAVGQELGRRVPLCLASATAALKCIAGFCRPVHLTALENVYGARGEKRDSRERDACL